MRFFSSKPYLRSSAFFTFIFFTANALLYGEVSPGVSLPDASSGPPLIYHIQDAHSDPAAQRDIARIIRQLKESQHIDLVLVEAAVGKLDAETLQWTARRGVNQKMARRLTEMGEMSGADIYLSRHGNSLPFVGIESAALYRANLNELKKVYSRQSEISQWLKATEEKLEARISRLANQGLLRLLRTQLGLDRLTHLKSLLRKLPAKDMNPIRYASLVRYVRLNEEAGSVSSGKAMSQWQTLEKKHRLSGEWKEKFFGNRLKKNPRFELEKLYALLSDSAQGFDFKQYPDLVKYLRARIYQYEINAQELGREIEGWLEDQIRGAARRPEEKAVASQIHNFRLLRKLLRLELTRKEWLSFPRKRESSDFRFVSMPKSLDSRFRGND
ncbi:MAG: hypothetical protein HY586_01005, partial [Candidatus Omnitrophica bacterium]|nr:hypothetical protein [Candidatus Omnitrophota bacterium]